MEMNYLDYIKKFLGETPEMLPVPTNSRPKISPDPSLKAILFDVYGTIVISASGDVEESEITSLNLKKSLDAAGIKLASHRKDTGTLLLNMLNDFKNRIREFHESEKSADLPFPEVDIMEIWESVIREYHSRNLLIMEDTLCIKCFTFVFEVLSNTIYPMPKMKEVIHSLAMKEFPLGIISNAQFYTPVILNYFMNNTISEEMEVKPFDKDLTVFSYQYKRSKPDNFLFEKVREQCSVKYNLKPREVLFVGNDMFRDVMPAHNAGFKTALFAGDARSLRMRRDYPGVNGLEPDFIITELNQLLKIIE